MQDKSDINQDVIGMSPKASGAAAAGSEALDQASREALSAMMDDEAQELELRRIVRAGASDTRIGEQWRRYHLVRDSLQQEAHSNPSVNLLAGINARLEEESKPHQNSMTFIPALKSAARRLGQAGIAASVAFTVLYGASSLQVALESEAGAGSAATMLADSSAGQPETYGNYTPSNLTRTVSVDAEARDRIQRAVYQFSDTESRNFTPGTAYTFPSEPQADAEADAERLSER